MGRWSTRGLHMRKKTDGRGKELLRRIPGRREGHMPVAI
jgi:hypothetical protein